MKERLILTIIISWGYVLNMYARDIIIRNQQEYDSLAQNLYILLKEQEELNIILDNGTFFFNDNNELKIFQSNCSLNIRGNRNTYLVADGENYINSEAEELYKGKWYKIKLKKQLNQYCTFQDENHNPIPLANSGFLNDSLQINISNEAIRLLDSQKRIAQIAIPQELNFIKNKQTDYFKQSLICYKAQWTDCYREILYSDNKYLYFNLSEWLYQNFDQYVGNMFNWSKNNKYGMKPYVPFFITNLPQAAKENTIFYDNEYIYIPKNIQKVHVCRYNKWIDVKYTTKPIKIENIFVCGTSLTDKIMTYGGLDYDYRSDLIHYIGSENLFLYNCKFSNMGNDLCCIRNSNNVVINQCKFTDNYTDGIAYFLGTTNNRGFKFTNNYIYNPKKLITHIECIRLDAHASDIVISYNECINISRIFVKIGKCNNIEIKNNHLYNTKDFNYYPLKNLSSDTGVLIYAHVDSPFTMSNNIIHDLASNLHYTGVMVDNGSGNATIRGNLIFNVGDECVYCWQNKKHKTSNHNNILDSNILIGNVNYGGYDTNAINNSSYFNNITVLNNKYSVFQNSKASNKGGNIQCSDYQVKNGIILFPKQIYEKIKSNKKISSEIQNRIKILNSK